ncbi:MAG TPA: UDP-N-acetylmuramoyl-tripeptide--D-alanyl-D-alanine ligase [Bacillota bacterium]
MRCGAGEVATACEGALVAGDPSTAVTGVSIDSRTLRPGDAFVALPGSRSDGHAFAAEAAARGAAALIVSRWPLPGALPRPLPVILVDDTLAALTRWAAAHRRRFDVPVVGVTGSVGKTTTKEMVAAVVGRRLRVLKSPGNFNNEIGVPLGILAWEQAHGAAVFELAMRGPGEIRRLCDLVQPGIGVVINVREVHLEGLGSLEAVAAAKAELIQALPASGAAVLNADDPLVRAMAARTGARLVTFGLSSDALVRAEGLADDHPFRISFTLVWPRGRAPVAIPAAGRHLVHNALAAAAVALVLGLPAGDVVDGLAAFRPADRRLAIHEVDGVTVIDDTYNASPTSLRAALDAAARLPRAGRLVVVLGDMLELGPAAGRAHREAGAWMAAEADLFLAVGAETAAAVAEARRCGMAPGAAQHFADRRELTEALRGLVREGDVVLVKGSRGMAMDEVADALLTGDGDPSEAGS